MQKSTPLTFDKLSEENKKRCESPEGFDHACDSWTPTDWACATAGELGELCNLLKKQLRTKTATKPNLKDTVTHAQIAEEIGGTLLYLDLLATRLGMSLEGCVRYEFNRVSEKRGYPILI